MPLVNKEILDELQIPPLSEEELVDQPSTAPITEKLPELPTQTSVCSPSSQINSHNQEGLIAGAVAHLSTATSITSSVLGCAVASSITLPSSNTPLGASSLNPSTTQTPTSNTCSCSTSLPPSSLPSSDGNSQISTNSTQSTQSPLVVPNNKSTTVQVPVTLCCRPSSLSGAIADSGNLSDGEDEGIVDMDGAMGSSSCAVNSDQSASEDSSLTSDSDRTLVGDPPEDKLSNTSDSPDYHNVSSPEENKEKNIDDVWGLPLHMQDDWNYESPKEEVKHYFKAHLPIETKDALPVLTVSVDKRITVGQFKKELMKYVGVSHENFKLFKIYPNSTQEFEFTRMTDTLTCYVEFYVMKIQLSRALLPGEHKCKIYLLDPKSSEEPAIFLIDTVIRNGESVKSVKDAIVREVNSKSLNEIQLDLQLVRIRKKSWRNPVTIYPDHHVFGNEISLYPNFELYLQVLTEPDTINKDGDEICIFVKRWRPSSYTTDPLVEIILSEQTTDELRAKLSKLSGIDAEDIMFAKGRGSFPSDMSVLDVATELDWTQRPGSLDQKSFFMQDDGAVVYYRDKFEKTKKLTDSERDEYVNSESTRLNRESPYSASSPNRYNSNRKSKERGLRIYLPENP